jgi:SAM-dependent methyltransferase
MRDFPGARNNERDTLLDYVALRPGMVVLDVQAAGGYLADEVHRRLGPVATILCVEPNSELRNRLKPAYTALADPVENFLSIDSETVDIVLGLVALHHSHSHAATIGECCRVLRPGGELAICDVPAGSRVAEWLNGFVARHCPAGHNGNFPEPGSMTRLCREAGFTGIVEELRDVPWQFARRADIAVFFKGLFGLSAPIETIDRAIDDYFVVTESEHGCTIGWQLAYAHARKPH